MGSIALSTYQFKLIKYFFVLFNFYPEFHHYLIKINFVLIDSAILVGINAIIIHACP